MIFSFVQPNPPEKSGEQGVEVEAIQACVDQLWEQYDKDGSGALE